MSTQNSDDLLDQPPTDMDHRHTPAIAQAGLLGRWIEKGGIVFAVGIVISMLILILEVFLRYVLNAPTIWAHETTIFLCATAFVYGGLYCAARNTHIRVVIIYDFVSPRVRRWLDIIISVISAVASAFFAWAAWTMVNRATFAPTGKLRFETSGSAWDPPTPAMLKIFLFVTLIALAVQFLVLAFNYARQQPASSTS